MEIHDDEQMTVTCKDGTNSCEQQRLRKKGGQGIILTRQCKNRLTQNKVVTPESYEYGKGKGCAMTRLKRIAWEMYSTAVDCVWCLFLTSQPSVVTWLGYELKVGCAGYLHCNLFPLQATWVCFCGTFILWQRVADVFVATQNPTWILIS